MADLVALKERLDGVRRRHADAVASASKFVKGVLVIVGAFVAGVAQFAEWGQQGTPSVAQTTGIAACVLVFIGGLFILRTEHDAAEAVETASRALDAAREVEDNLEGISELAAETQRLAETYQICLSLRGVLEQSGIGAAGGLDDLIRAMFDIVALPLATAIGFVQGDRWTMGVYRAVPSLEVGKVELQCVAQDRAIKCTLQEARTWPEGVGIAGIAYTNQREVIVPDLRTEGVASIFGPRDKTRPYDADRYVSMVSVPIIVAGLDKPWGVVNATSARAGHFACSTNPGFKYDEPIRALAAFCALAVAIDVARAKARQASSMPVRSPVASGSTSV